MRRRKVSLGKRLAFFIIFAITIIAVLLAGFGLRSGDTPYIKSAKEIRTGIDIRGGVNATFVPADENIVPTDEQLEAARTIFETRLEDDGIMDYTITTDNNNKAIIVEFPWKVGETDFDPQAAIQELGETANLTFCSLKKNAQGQIIDAEGHVMPDENGNGSAEFIAPVADVELLSGKHIKSSAPAYQEGKAVVSLEFTDEGKEVFAKATTDYINDYIGIFLDGEAISWPKVNSTITDGQAIIEGGFTNETATQLANRINAGALPYALTSSNYNSVTATMGSKALNVMLLAGLITLIVIALFMLTMYRLPGFVACVNLVLQLAIQLLLFANLDLTITLPGIAGVILSIGMSVDSNVIISERIREEMRKGKSLIGAVDTGYGKALSAIIDCNITTAVVAILLIIFGSGAVLSFGYTLLIGIVLNFFVSVLASKWMLRSLSSYNFLKNPKLYGYKEVENND